MIDLQPLNAIRQHHDSIGRALESLMRAREDVVMLPPGTCEIDHIDNQIERLHAHMDTIRRCAQSAGFQLNLD
jgi:hypothetical protein